MSDNILTRRQLLGSAGAVIAGVSAAQGQQGARPAPSTAKPVPPPARPRLTLDSGPRVAPVDEITMVSEFEDSAKLKLPASVLSTIAGTDRRGFDRITVRSRMLVRTVEMDLSVGLFGDTLFAPILVGPVSEQKRYHADAELGTVQGASAGNAAVVVGSRSSVPIDRLAAAAKTPLWYQVWAEADAKAQIERAVKAGVRAVVVTLGTAPGAAAAAAGPDWAAIDGLRQGLSVPMLVKGVMTAADARVALQHGVQGIIVSNWGTASKAAPMLALGSIVDAVAGKVPVLVDGSFRLGVDVYRALALGAQGVLIGRPAMWALAAYGAIGVQTMVEMLQTELAQTMSACSNPNIKSITRSFVQIHATAMP
jgi:4-hydroxymandelate oxidase